MSFIYEINYIFFLSQVRFRNNFDLLMLRITRSIDQYWVNCNKFSSKRYAQYMVSCSFKISVNVKNEFYTNGIKKQNIFLIKNQSAFGLDST